MRRLELVARVVDQSTLDLGNRFYAVAGPVQLEMGAFVRVTIEGLEEEAVTRECWPELETPEQRAERERVIAKAFEEEVETWDL